MVTAATARFAVDDDDGWNVAKSGGYRIEYPYCHALSRESVYKTEL